MLIYQILYKFFDKHITVNFDDADLAKTLSGIWRAIGAFLFPKV